MTTMMLKVEESYVEKFLHVLDALPHGMVSIQEDELRNELERRIAKMESRPESATAYMDGMDTMLKRVKAAHARR